MSQAAAATTTGWLDVSSSTAGPFEPTRTGAAWYERLVERGDRLGSDYGKAQLEARPREESCLASGLLSAWSE